MLKQEVRYRLNQCPFHRTQILKQILSMETRSRKSVEAIIMNDHELRDMYFRQTKFLSYFESQLKAKLCSYKTEVSSAKYTTESEMINVSHKVLQFPAELPGVGRLFGAILQPVMTFMVMETCRLFEGGLRLSELKLIDMLSWYENNQSTVWSLLVDVGVDIFQNYDTRLNEDAFDFAAKEELMQQAIKKIIRLIAEKNMKSEFKISLNMREVRNNKCSCEKTKHVLKEIHPMEHHKTKDEKKGVYGNFCHSDKENQMKSRNEHVRKSTVDRTTVQNEGNRQVSQLKTKKLPLKEINYNEKLRSEESIKVEKEKSKEVITVIKCKTLKPSVQCSDKKNLNTEYCIEKEQRAEKNKLHNISHQLIPLRNEEKQKKPGTCMETGNKQLPDLQTRERTIINREMKIKKSDIINLKPIVEIYKREDELKDKNLKRKVVISEINRNILEKYAVDKNKDTKKNDSSIDTFTRAIATKAIKILPTLNAAIEVTEKIIMPLRTSGVEKNENVCQFVGRFNSVPKSLKQVAEHANYVRAECLKGNLEINSLHCYRLLVPNEIHVNFDIKIKNHDLLMENSFCSMDQTLSNCQIVNRNKMTAPVKNCSDVKKSLQTELGSASKLENNKMNDCQTVEIEKYQGKTFEKTATSIDGQLYEIRLLTLLLLMGLSVEVYKFNLASNMKQAHKLDDLVFKCYYNNRKMPKLIFVQAKHRKITEKYSKRSKVKINHLFPGPKVKKTDFSLIKYFQSYLNIRGQFSESKVGDPIFGSRFHEVECEVVMYTNAVAAFTRWDGKLLDGIEKVKVEPENILNFLTDRESREYFYYRIIRGKNKYLDRQINALKQVSSCESDITEFLSKLKLFIGQPSASQLSGMIQRKIQQEYRVGSENLLAVCRLLESSVLKWWNEENYYLTKDNMFLYDAISFSRKFEVNVHQPLLTGRVTERSGPPATYRPSTLTTFNRIRNSGDKLHHWIGDELYLKLPAKIIEVNTAEEDKEKFNIKRIARKIYKYFTRYKKEEKFSIKRFPVYCCKHPVPILACNQESGNGKLFLDALDYRPENIEDQSGGSSHRTATGSSGGKP